MRKRSLTIVGLGDSTTAGTPGFRSPLEAPPRGDGNPESQYAHWMMQSHPEWTVLNRGINGETSEEIRARLPRDVLQVHPAYAIVLAGVNDIFRGDRPETVERHLAAMYADILDAGIVPVAATVLPYNMATARSSGDILTLNAWIENLTKVLGILFCDTHAAVADPGDTNRLRGTPDGLHPDVAGYRAMGEALVRTIEDHLRRAGSRSFCTTGSSRSWADGSESERRPRTSWRSHWSRWPCGSSPRSPRRSLAGRSKPTGRSSARAASMCASRVRSRSGCGTPS